MVQFPGLTKRSIQLGDGLSPLYIPLLLLTLLLAHRSQISAASSGLLPKDKVLTLPSIKWNSKLIANSPELKRLYACMAIIDTLANEQESMKDKTVEETTAYLLEKIVNLSQQKKPKNARLVPKSAINEKTIEVHRHGRMAQLIGLFQSKSVFDPSTVFPSTPIANLSISQLLSSFNTTVEKLEIQRPALDSEWANWVASAPNPEEAEIHALECLLKKEFNMDGDQIIFDDAIGFGSDTNLLPIEKIFNMERPTTSVSPPGQLSEKQKENPFLVAAVEQQKTLFEESTKGKKQASNPIARLQALNPTQKPSARKGRGSRARKNTST